MENSWRFRPVQASLCPVCSAPHFPFCPPLPHLAAVEIHRRFPPPDLYYAPAAPPMPPMPPPPTFHPPLPPHRFLNDEFLERESFRKRMRVEDPMMMLAFDRTADDERRLNLIRSHGQQQSNGFEASWDDHQRSFHDPRLSSNGGIGHQTRSFSEIPDSHGIDRLVYQERKDLLSGEFDSHKSGPVDPYGRMEQFDGSWQPSRSFRAGEYAESSNNYAARPVLDSVPGFWHENSPCFLPIEDSSRFLPKQSQYDGVQKSHGSMQHSVENRIENQHSEVMRAPFEFKPPIAEQILRPLKSQSYPIVEQSKQGGYLPLSDDGNGHGMCTVMMSGVHTSQTYPPLPPQPPLPPYPELPPLHLPVTTAVQTSHFATTTVMDSTSATMRPPLSDQVSPGHYPFPRANLYNEPHVHTSTGFATEGLPSIHETLSKDYLEDRRQTFPLKHSLKDKPTTVDACQLFRQPHRASRPDHIVVILRGLPGSGKSYLAKALRDLEVENGGKAPRIHAMDDYFMIEVEKKVEDNEVSKLSGSSRGKKQITKKVIEYCYEPEMEEAYRSSMLKAFKKTVDEGSFTFIIVDDRNLRVADFAQFWAIAKRSGYEVYLLEAAYKDPMGCAARNVHGFTVDDIQQMAEQWEEAPSLYLKLDIQSLFRGDNLNELSIQEVDMETDDAPYDEEEAQKLQERKGTKAADEKSLDYSSDGGPTKVGERWNTEDEDEDEEEPAIVNELGKSKWSKDLDEDIESSNSDKANLSALSGLIQAYGKSEKFVHWGDMVDQSGFSIGAARKWSKSSLIIGPGSGYSLGTNPLPEEEVTPEATAKRNISESKKRFTEQLRAERESFKAVFDRRRQRIGGLWDAEDE